MTYVTRREVYVLHVPGEGWLAECGGDWGPKYMPRRTPLEGVMFFNGHEAHEEARRASWSNVQVQKGVLEMKLTLDEGK